MWCRAFLLLSAACSAQAFGFAARPLHARTRSRIAPPFMSAIDPNKTHRTAEWWEDDTATLLQVANALGRWDSAAEWAERTEFAVVNSARSESMAQGATVERHEMARRNGNVERVAFTQNVPKLPFTNEKLAASLGKSVEEMQGMPVSKTALNLLYDALAQSKTSMLPEKTVDARRKAFFTPEGGLDEGAMLQGLFKSRATVTLGWILLGKGQLYGAVFAGRILLDVTGTFDKIQEVLGPFAEGLYWVLSFGVAVFAVQSSAAMARRTADYETMSKEEAEVEQEAARFASRASDNPLEKISTKLAQLGRSGEGEDT